MKNGFIVIIGSIFMVIIFLSTVFVNTSVKEDRVAIGKLEKDVEELKSDILFQEIEITSLTNPKFVYNYILANDYKPIKIKDITSIYIKKDSE